MIISSTKVVFTSAIYGSFGLRHSVVPCYDLRFANECLGNVSHKY